MARTTDIAVAGIIEVDNEISLTPFIDAANLLVTNVCTNSGYTEATLEMIERYLSAHFYLLRDPQIRSSQIMGGTGEAYEQISTDLGLSVTKYGQQAKVLDYKGNLAVLDVALKKKLAPRKQSLHWLGTDPNETP